MTPSCSHNAGTFEPDGSRRRSRQRAPAGGIRRPRRRGPRPPAPTPDPARRARPGFPCAVGFTGTMRYPNFCSALRHVVAGPAGRFATAPRMAMVRMRRRNASISGRGVLEHDSASCCVHRRIQDFTNPAPHRKRQGHAAERTAENLQRAHRAGRSRHSRGGRRERAERCACHRPAARAQLPRRSVRLLQVEAPVRHDRVPGRNTARYHTS